MFDLIKNCIEYAHLTPQLKTIDHGKLIDIIELKIELYCAAMENKYKGKPTTLADWRDGYTENEQHELETWGTAILLKDKITQYKEALKAENEEEKSEILENLKIEIIKMLYDIL